MIVDAGAPVAHPSGMTDVVANAWRGLAQFLVALALCLMLPSRRGHFATGKLDEERLLVRDLGGYEAYRGHVRYRLVPFVW